jgi:hypothetical protein
MLRMTLLAGLMASGSLAAEHQAATLQECAELELRVAGLFRVGTASLHLSDCTGAGEQILAAVPKQFSLELARDFDGADLSDTARDLLVRNLALADANDLPTALACLADAYVDAGPGDRYDVIYRPGDSLSLYLNDQPLRRCEDSGHAEKYFLIWFGEQPFHRRMRDVLLQRAAESARG